MHVYVYFIRIFYSTLPGNYSSYNFLLNTLMQVDLHCILQLECIQQDDDESMQERTL